MYSIKEILTNEKWCPELIYPAVSFTQSFQYGEWQKNSGKKVRRFLVTENEIPVSFFQIIFFPLIIGKYFGYVPYGPIIENEDIELIKFIKECLFEIAKSENAVFIRTDFSPIISADLSGLFTKVKKYSYLGSYFQPRFEWVLNIENNADTLLCNMHQKTRYSINYAQKNGVEIKIIDKNLLEYLSDFVNLLKSTSSRNGFSLHKESYYKNIIENSVEDSVFFSIAFYEGKPLSIDLIYLYGDTAMYLFGGSSDEHRKLCASHLALWRAILFAKDKGSKNFNFGGIEDPERELYKNWQGLTVFKKRFGGVILEHSEYYDLVQDPFLYYLYNMRKLIKKIF